MTRRSILPWSEIRRNCFLGGTVLSNTNQNAADFVLPGAENHLASRTDSRRDYAAGIRFETVVGTSLSEANSNEKSLQSLAPRL
jgi:hypothetical protein